jgi:hypothetical protein
VSDKKGEILECLWNIFISHEDGRRQRESEEEESWGKYWSIISPDPNLILLPSDSNYIQIQAFWNNIGSILTKQTILNCQRLKYVWNVKVQLESHVPVDVEIISLVGHHHVTQLYKLHTLQVNQISPPVQI